MESRHWGKRHTVGIVAFVLAILVVNLLLPWLALPGPNPSAKALEGAGAWRLATWLLNIILLGAFFLVIGDGVTGIFWRGCLIDNRNRVSLSRLQLLLWTVVVLSAFLTVATFKIHSDPKGDPLNIKVPVQVWGLLGISTGSSVSAAALKYVKRNTSADKDALESALKTTKKSMTSEEEKQATEREGLLATKSALNDSSISDLFTGDEVGSAAQLELGKVQMFFFTLIVVLAYGINVGSILYSVGGLPKALPDVSEGMVVLLLISHAGFLGAKSIPASPTPHTG